MSRLELYAYGVGPVALITGVMFVLGYGFGRSAGRPLRRYKEVIRFLIYANSMLWIVPPLGVLVSGFTYRASKDWRIHRSTRPWSLFCLSLSIGLMLLVAYWSLPTDPPVRP